MALPLIEAFTARAVGSYWDKFKASQALPPYLGASLFGVDKKMGLELSFIQGEDAMPVALRASNFDAKAPLRDAIGFTSISNTMPFFRDSYMVSEKDEQDYMSYLQSDERYTQQILKQIMKNPMMLIQGANVVPERMIWQLLAPADGIPKIDVKIGSQAYTIDYTADNGVAYKAKNFISLSGTNLWSAPATATPIQDLVDAQEQQTTNRGMKLSTFVMNQKTWKQLVNAADTRTQVLGGIAVNAGVRLKDADVKAHLLDNYGITIIVYDQVYVNEAGVVTKYIPDGVVTALSQGVTQLGTVWYGTTPEERSGSLTDGTLSIVNTGVSVYTYTTNHPINTHCVVSEIVLPSYENMNSVVVMKVA